MTGLVFLIFGLGFLLLAAHPFISYPLSLKWIARRYPKPIRFNDAPDKTPPTVALCLCAYNEETVLEAKIENMVAMRRVVPNLEILVYVDQSSDRTAEIAERYNGQIQTVIAPRRTGKTHGMNLLVSSTAAEIVVFTDANVLFADDALRHLLQPFEDPNVGCALGHLKYISSRDTSTASTGSLYWRLEERMKALETLSGSAITADGAIFAFRRNLHRLPPNNVADDIFISLSILCAGFRVVRVAQAVAYEDISVDATQEFNRKIRIGCLAYSAHRMLWPELRRLPTIELYKYVSHKLIRWFTIYLLVLAYLCFVIALMSSFGVIIGLVVGFCVGAGLVLLGSTTSGTLGKFGSILQSFMATGIGVWRSYRGARFETWSSPTRTKVSMQDLLVQGGKPVAVHGDLTNDSNVE